MEHKDYRLAAVMFTDIVGFSRMMGEDEQGTLQVLDFHNNLVREEVTKHRGSVIKTIGDAFLAQFQTALDAVKCSIAVQDGLRQYNESKLGKEIRVRIGVHLGDIYFYENDALGEGINIASRLQSITEPGHITISREVYSQVSGKLAMKVEGRGQVQLKNITREVHAYEIIPGGEDNDSSAYRKAQQAQQAPVAEPVARPSDPEPAAQVAPSAPSRGPAPSFRDVRDEWRSLRSQIKDEVKAELRGGPERWKDVKDQIRDEFHRSRSSFQGPGATVTFDPASVVKEIFRDPLDDLKREDGTPASAYQIYREKRLRQAAKGGGGFRGHFIPFAAVNGFLALINLTTSPEFLWFLFPLGGWGIGLLSHAAGFVAGQLTAGELRRLDDASDEDFRVIKKYQDSRGGFLGHFVSNAAVSAFLIMIGLVTGGGFPWLFIPVAAMGVGVLSHLSGYLTKRGEFRSLWKGLLTGKSRPSKKVKGAAAEPVPEVDPVVRKARTLRDSIVAQVSGMKGGNPFGDDMTQTLDNYVLQIGELSAIEQELGRVVVSFNPADLEAEAVSVRGKIATTTSSALKFEYEKSLSSIEKQKQSFEDLAEQQELLNLRIKGAMGSLQQMQVDLARIKSLSDGQKDPSFLPIKERSEELSRYIEDYREGLKEIPD
jgi:class 3 adenylate cyclase